MHVLTHSLTRSLTHSLTHSLSPLLHPHVVVGGGQDAPARSAAAATTVRTTATATATTTTTTTTTTARAGVHAAARVALEQGPAPLRGRYAVTGGVGLALSSPPRQCIGSCLTGGVPLQS